MCNGHKVMLWHESKQCGFISISVLKQFSVTSWGSLWGWTWLYNTKVDYKYEDDDEVILFLLFYNNVEIFVLPLSW